MATKKFIELQEFSDADLQAELDATEGKFQKIQFDHAITGLDNPLLIREIRRDIARLKTEIRSRALKAAAPEQLAKRSKIRARRRRGK